jgi:hypothetical protein
MDYPTREQLYAEVDDWFRSERPDAPAKFSKDAPEHEALRKEWVGIRDVILAEYVNRVYWEVYPDAPIKIDPADPAHDRYEKGWLEIRDQIMSAAPQPPVHEGERDLSRIRASALEHIEYRLTEIREELHSDIRATIETMVDNYRSAIETGAIGPTDSWKSDLVEVISNEDPEHKVQLKLFAVFYQDVYDGGLEVFEVVKPLAS